MKQGQWNAQWIGYAYDPREDLGVFAFRNRFSLDAQPDELRVRASADNRYKLTLNGRLVGFGPQRGDLRHWFYETYDLAPFLKEGENELLALVWNFGWMAPMAQHSARTGFVCEQLQTERERPVRSRTEDVSSAGLSTPGSWEVARVEGWGFEMMAKQATEFYIDVGPGEVVDLRERELEWREPHVICAAEDRGTLTGGTPWMLVPRSIPPMRYERREKRPFVRSDYLASMPPHSRPLAFPLELQPGESVLLDFEELLCAYPRLTLEGSSGLTVTLTYDESLWQEDGLKGNRNEVAGKHLRGYQDKIILGESTCVFEPLWWRTWRYMLIEVSVDAGQEPCAPSGAGVAVKAVEAYETGYPLQVGSSFTANDPRTQSIWDVSVRTAERCAGETYFDCPYWEQLQYVGDTRIQALIGYYLGRDRALQRNAVETLGWSIMEDGLTQSRYPSRQTQVIPPFSLWWVMMLYDQMLYDPDRSKYAGLTGSDPASKVLRGYWKLVKRGSSFWPFGDWVPRWGWGVPPGGVRDTMHLLLAGLAQAAATLLLNKRGLEDEPEFAQLMWLNSTDEQTNERMYGIGSEGLEKNAGLIKAKKDREWNPSEHSEALYRVLQNMCYREVDPWPAAELQAANAAKCTYYFSYYKHLAMAAADPGFDYLTELQPWKEMIEDGLTTFAENPEPTRSDCHAWSAHPILGFFQIVAGVTSVSPGWGKAKIAPRPGSLRRFDARIAHPEGELQVKYDEGRLAIDTPVETTLEWQGKSESLPPGSHTISS